MKKLIVLSLIFLSVIGNAVASLDVFDDIANAIRSGDSKSISRYFDTTVDLTIIDQEEVYSKVQAEQIMRDFFSKNTPKSFAIIHKGESREGARYAIGSMVTAQGITYRTYFYIKQQGSTVIVKELRFMKE